MKGGIVNEKVLGLSVIHDFPLAIMKYSTHRVQVITSFFPVLMTLSDADISKEVSDPVAPRYIQLC
jgi:hypothetical protein